MLRQFVLTAGMIFAALVASAHQLDASQEFEKFMSCEAGAKKFTVKEAETRLKTFGLIKHKLMIKLLAENDGFIFLPPRQDSSLPLFGNDVAAAYVTNESGDGNGTETSVVVLLKNPNAKQIASNLNIKKGDHGVTINVFETEYTRLADIHNYLAIKDIDISLPFEEYGVVSAKILLYCSSYSIFDDKNSEITDSKK